MVGETFTVGDLHSFTPCRFVSAHPNATLQAPLEAVASKRLFGSDHPSELGSGESSTALRHRWESHTVCSGDREPQHIPTSPQHLDRIVCEHGIMADERCLFSVGLRD